MIVVYHICAIGEFQPIVDRQLKLLKSLFKSNYKNFFIHINIVGSYVSLPFWLSGISAVYYNEDPEVYEIPSINLVKTIADLQGVNTPILYLNTRGVSHSGSKRYFIDKWSDILEYFCLSHYDSCIEKLQEGYDAVSALYFQKPVPHFSGNMWWANSDYIKKLPYLTPETTIYKKFKPELEGKERTIGISRHDCEFWILRDLKVNYFSYFNTVKCLYYEEEEPKSYRILNYK